LIYAVVNVIISLPGLYGYAAVIFNNPTFSPHMNALSKFVIFSSSIHQLGFLLFSSLPFAIGTVQDAGLIFLSSMSNTIANRILNEGGTADDVLSTTLVLLSLGTAMLGLVLVAMGHFKLADAVSYLPMPVVGGYLAFIGYFCLTAGVGLCISESMMVPADWAYLLEPHNLVLAIPGLLSGLCMTIVSRKCDSDAALPLLMVLIPSIFYIVIFSTGIGLDGAREGGWVGDVAPPGINAHVFLKWKMSVYSVRSHTYRIFLPCSACQRSLPPHRFQASSLEFDI
jgi:SulP family sulfate permease